MDGAIAIYDAMHGVQAQSETVWRQAERYNVPRLAFINKLDRDGSSIKLTLNGMRSRLGCTPLLVQLPVGAAELPASIPHVAAGALGGVVDLLQLQLVTWSDEEGSRIERRDLHTRSEASDLLAKSCSARSQLVETLAEQDEQIADAFLSGADTSSTDSSSPFSAKALSEAIRRVVCTHDKALTAATTANAEEQRRGVSRIVPVLLGSAFKKRCRPFARCACLPGSLQGRAAFA